MQGQHVSKLRLSTPANSVLYIHGMPGPGSWFRFIRLSRIQPIDLLGHYLWYKSDVCLSWLKPGRSDDSKWKRKRVCSSKMCQGKPHNLCCVCQNPRIICKYICPFSLTFGHPVQRGQNSIIHQTLGWSHWSKN